MIFFLFLAFVYFTESKDCLDHYDLIVELPYFPQDDALCMYSGSFDNNLNFFYWLVKKPGKTRSLVVWLTGVPGESGLVPLF